MRIIWARDKGVMTCGPEIIMCTSVVRNELNSRRKLHDPRDVVRAIVDDKYSGPYMPRPFPLGMWHIFGYDMTHDVNYAPIKFFTNAHQLVELWDLDDRGGYDKPSGETVDDTSYWLHFARDSKTTLGCGRLGSAYEARVLQKIVDSAKARGELIELEVV